MAYIVDYWKLPNRRRNLLLWFRLIRPRYGLWKHKRWLKQIPKDMTLVKSKRLRRVMQQLFGDPFTQIGDDLLYESVLDPDENPLDFYADMGFEIDHIEDARTPWEALEGWAYTYMLITGHAPMQIMVDVGTWTKVLDHKHPDHTHPIIMLRKIGVMGYHEIPVLLNPAGYLRIIPCTDDWCKD